MPSQPPGYEAIETDGELEKIVREPECKARTGLSRSTRWRLERDGKFPRRRRLGPNSVGWLLSELSAWMKPAAAGEPGNEKR